MEKSQLDLCLKVLRKLHDSGVLDNVIVVVEFEDMSIRIPHPAAYALHKIIVFERRKVRDKAEKDKFQIINLLDYLLGSQEYRRELKRIFDSMHGKWQKKIWKSLEVMADEKIGSMKEVLS